MTSRGHLIYLSALRQDKEDLTFMTDVHLSYSSNRLSRKELFILTLPPSLPKALCKLNFTENWCAKIYGFLEDYFKFLSYFCFLGTLCFLSK